MAIGNPLIVEVEASNTDAAYVRPVSNVTNWGVACSAPKTADNSGNAIVNPSLITRAEQHWVKLGQRGTTLQVRLKYETAGSISTQVVVQIFGRDGNLITERLLDSSGTHPLSLTADTSNDARDATYSYTQPVEVDCNGNSEVLVAIKTALAGTGLDAPAILVRLK